MAALVLWAGAAMANPEEWRQGEWPRTDFSRHSIDYSEIKSGGPPKDGIPAIDNPRFEDLKEGQEEGWAAGLADTEPVISFSVGSDARAYPLRVLMWHEIVNDTVGGEPGGCHLLPALQRGPGLRAHRQRPRARLRRHGQAQALRSRHV